MTRPAFIDISTPITNDVLTDPPPRRPRIAYTDQMEKLQNREALPDNRFTVTCFPVKVARASAGWVRAVAMIDA